MMVPYPEMKDIIIVKRFETTTVISDYKCFSAKKWIRQRNFIK